MAQNSNIAWTDHTANLWWGCVEVAPECDNCYAREWAKRYDRAKWGPHEPRLAIKSVHSDLKKFQKQAAAAGRVDRVFVGSMMDIGETPMPMMDAKGEPVDATTGTLRQAFANEVVPASPNLLFLLLSKRPQNYPSLFRQWLTTPPANVMFGTTIGTLKTKAHALPAIKRMPGRKFLSVEPLMDHIDFTPDDLEGIEWVITGCESRSKSAGRFADEYETAARRIMLACKASGVMYFNKQMPIGGRVSHDPSEWPEDLREQSVPTIPS